MAEQVIITEFRNDVSKSVAEINQLIAATQKLDATSDKAAKDIDKDFEKVEKAAKETRVEVNSTTGSIQRMGTQSGSAIKGLGTQFSSLKNLAMQLGPAIGVAFGTDAIIQFGKASVNAYIDAEKNASLLLNALNGNVGAQQRLMDQASRIQETTVYDDDSVQVAQTFLATQGRTEEQIMKTIDAAVQLSAVTGDDLQTSVEKLDRTYEGSIGRLGQLDERFKGLTKEQLANGAAIDLVAEKYKGYAEAAGETTAGRIARAQNQIGELQEAIGGELLLAVGDLFEAFNSGSVDGFISNLAEVEERLNPLGTGLGGLISTLGSLNEALNALKAGNYQEAFEALGKAAIDYLGVMNPVVGITRLVLDQFGLFDESLSAADESLQRNIAVNNTWMNALREGGTALEEFYTRANAAYGITREQFDAYVVAERKKLEVDKQDNEQTAEKITYLQALNKELGEITSKVQNQVAQGGIVQQADVDRTIRLQAELKKAAEEYAALIQRTRDRTGFNASPVATVTPVGLDLPTGDSVADLETKNMGENAEAQSKILAGQKEEFFKSYEERQQFLSQYAQTDAERAEIQYNMEQMALQNALDQKLITESEYIDLRKGLYENYSNFQTQLEAQNAANMIAIFGESVSGISQIYSALAEDAEKNAAFQKAMAIFDASLKLGQAIAAGVATAASSGDPYTIAARVAAAAVSIGSALAGVITSIKSAQAPSTPSFFKGTPYLQRGNNKAGVDTIPVMANEGEAIIPTVENNKYPGLAEAWISGNLEKYIHRNFAAPMVEEVLRQKQSRQQELLAEAIAVNLTGIKFNDGRLFGAAVTHNKLLMEISANTKQAKRNKRSLN